MLKINLEYRKGILFIRLKGELTRFTYQSLLNYLMPLINEKGIKYLVFNLDCIKLIDKAGKDALKIIISETKRNRGGGIICNTKTKFDENIRVVKDELVAFKLLKV